MRAIQFSRLGTPEEVAEVVELPDPPPPGPSEVLVELEAAPINPADLLMLRGLYGIRPPLPAVGGIEGVGRVAAVGDGVSHLRHGDRVSLAVIPGGTWRERMLGAAAGLAPLPDADPLQLAMLTANPATALLLLEEFVPLAAGDWVAQNAANSGVGLAVITLARLAGARTVSVVRSRPVGTTSFSLRRVTPRPACRLSGVAHRGQERRPQRRSRVKVPPGAA